MDKLIAALMTTILPKLLNKFLTPENVEKYSDKLLDICKKNIKKIKNDDIEDLLMQIIDMIDSMIGVK